MTSDEKLRIINNWCYWFRIEFSIDGKRYAAFSQTSGAGRTIRTQSFDDYDEVINAAYTIVRRRVRDSIVCGISQQTGYWV